MSDTENEQNEEHFRRRAKEHTVAGACLGAASAGAFAVLGTIACPACIVAAPALIGSGIWNAKKAKECSEDAEQPGCGPRVGDRIRFPT